MKKISKKDLKGLSFSFPMLSELQQKNVLGGIGTQDYVFTYSEELFSFLTNSLSGLGYTSSDSSGNLFWSRNSYIPYYPDANPGSNWYPDSTYSYYYDGVS